jgi:predicted acyl esterase
MCSKGPSHRVQVQSSWFPLINRNPQTFVPNILKAKPGDYRAQTHSVHYSRDFPSSITMSVVPEVQ